MYSISFEKVGIAWIATCHAGHPVNFRAESLVDALELASGYLIAYLSNKPAPTVNAPGSNRLN